MFAVPLCWIASKTYFPQAADEGAHMYVLEALLRGKTLYGEVPSARPPLSLLVPLVVRSLGFGILLAVRSAQLFWLLATAAVLYEAGRHAREGDAGRVLGLLTGGLFLLSADSANAWGFTGMSQTICLSFLSALFAVQGRARLAGVVAGLALLSGQHALPLLSASLALVVLCAPPRLTAPRALLEFVLAGAVPLVLFVGFLGATGSVDAAWRDLVAHHLFQFGVVGAAGSSNTSEVFAIPLLEATPILLLGIGGVVAAATRAEAWGRAFAIALVVCTLWALLLRNPEMLYLQPLMAALCPLAGVGALELWERLRLPKNRAMAMAVLTAVTVGGWSFAKARLDREDERSYPLLPHARAVEIARYQKLIYLAPMARIVAQRTTWSETVFGDLWVAPFVALGAKRRVAGELADFSTKWLASGSETSERLIARLERDNVKFAVFAKGYYLDTPSTRDYFLHCYRPVMQARRPEKRTEDGSQLPDLYLLEHLPIRPCGANTVIPTRN